MQAQIQALLEEGAERRVAVARSGGGATKVAKPQIFDGMLSKVVEFIMVYKLYIRMKLREELVEEQVQWMLSYVQGGAADVWKENVMEELEAGKLEYESVEEFFDELKEGIWWRRRGVSESSGVEEVRIGRENDGRIHTGV